MELRSFESVFPKMIEDNEFYVKVPFGEHLDSKRICKVVDFYCTDTSCDCCKVTLLFIDRQMQVIANISYGWQSKKFYQDWGLDSDEAKELAEGCLDIMSPSSESASLCLKAFNEMKKDKRVIERFKHRYALFKEKVLATPELQI